jgi:hypothetical protein
MAYGKRFWALIIDSAIEQKNGGSLWSAVARHRFGSHLRILQTSGTSRAVGFLAVIAKVSKLTTKAVPSQPHSKGSADLIYAHASFFLSPMFLSALPQWQKR